MGRRDDARPDRARVDGGQLTALVVDALVAPEGAVEGAPDAPFGAEA